MKRINNNKKQYIELTFNTFRLLKIGDKVYLNEIQAKGNFEIEEYEIINTRWIYSGENCLSPKTLKPFWYYQITYKKDKLIKYSDSAGYNYTRLYIKKDLIKILKTRKNRK